MVPNKRLDPYKQIIATLMSDVQTSHSEVFSPRVTKLTIQKMTSRLTREGTSFLTKTLPRLGKALDRALSGEVQLNVVGFRKIAHSKLPKLFGELFQLVFSHDGWVLPAPCVRSIRTLRQISYLFYKYELPYDSDLEQAVIDQFRIAEQELSAHHDLFSEIAELVDSNPDGFHRVFPVSRRTLIRRARILLAEVFSSFDPKDIYPKHGPGAVSTKEKLWDKYTWTSMSPRLVEQYPLDEYFYASLNAVCDNYHRFSEIDYRETPAKVILVPKDSRGPRLISCEPLAMQWIQQGLGRAMVRHVERHPLTKWSVHFTHQTYNQYGALLGSARGNYATLDLKEASDRVSNGLVRLLFPEPLLSALQSCRSQSTVLPSGEIQMLNKFAPMGSALCFPVMALTIWALLTAGSPDAYASEWALKVRPEFRKTKQPDSVSDSSQEEQVLEEAAVMNDNVATILTNGSFSNVYDCRPQVSYPIGLDIGILVYGDDVIVPTAQAANAIETLESFGLKVNRDKSFTNGFFRESCGVDAFRGHNVTPVRFRTVWSSTPSPEVYTSWIAYANWMHERGYLNTYELIVGWLLDSYREIPDKTMAHLGVPYLVEVPEANLPKYKRVNVHLQKMQVRVRSIRNRPIRKTIDGWKMLLRYFAETSNQSTNVGPWTNDKPRRSGVQVGDYAMHDHQPFSVSSYTKRKASCLAFSWR